MSDNIYNENIKLLKQHIYLNEEKIKNNFNKLYNDILLKTSFLINPSFSERKYCYINKIEEIQKCYICNNSVTFRKCYGYHKCCSKECMNIYEKTIAHEKNYQTKLEKYNNGNYNGSEKIKISKEKRKEIGEKIKKTKNNFSKEKWIEINNKIKNTKKIHFGNENYNNPNKSILSRYKNNKKVIFSKPNILYILKIENMKLIKIGITSNINKRIKTIIRESNIKDDIEIIKTYNIDNPWILEVKLHNKYTSYNKPLTIGGGRTEWFDEIILNNVILDIESELSK